MNILLSVGCILILNVSYAYCVSKPCASRKYSEGVVCVCNETYCDSMDVDNVVSPNGYVLTSSSASGDRFASTKGYYKPIKSENDIFSDGDDDDFERNIYKSYSPKWIKWQKLYGFQKVSITIEREKIYQKISGFGGAWTGSVSYLFDQMPEPLRKFIYRDYYSKTEGMGYSWMRIPIGGCDFDLSPWAYNEQPENDKQLTNMEQLDERDVRKVAQLSEVKATTGNNDFKIMAVAWSPPKWMKTNKNWAHEGYLQKEFYDTWALYHLKYARLMAKNGMPLAAISTGNEPAYTAGTRWMCMTWKPVEQGKWVEQYLGPAFRNSELNNTLIFGGDDQRYTFPSWFEKMASSNSRVLDYIDGLAVHWYADPDVSPSFLDDAHSEYGDKIILNTESCVGADAGDDAMPLLGAWHRAERYAKNIIEDLQHWVNGWIDWNLILDIKGGPNYVNNFVDAAIIFNTTSKTEFYKQPIFYVLAHFSKFIPPGSVRIVVHVYGANVTSVGFVRPDNSIAVIMYNEAHNAVSVSLKDSKKGTVELSLAAKSINSLVYF